MRGLLQQLLNLAGLVMLAVSLSWIALYTFTPATDRPYVDGSTNNSAVMPMGGFSGSVPEPTLARVRQLVASGQLRFFLLGGADAGFRGGAGREGGGVAAQVASWVESSCATVPGEDYGATSGAE